MQEQKQLALLAVQAAVDACRVDPQIFEKGAYQHAMDAIADAERFLVDAIEGRVIGATTNRTYKNFDLAVTKLVLLSVEYGGIFDLLMSRICDGKPLTSYAGLTAVHCFLRCLTDDHDYILNQSGEHAVIEVGDGYLLGPASLHAYLSHLI